MPICTRCAQSVTRLYTVYSSAHNLRLEQCPFCSALVDPYVEHDELTLVIDLILLKREVYRHLLFNRGLGMWEAEPKNRDENEVSYARKARVLWEKAMWLHLLKLGAALITVDTFIRWTHIRPEYFSSLPNHKAAYSGLDPGLLRTSIGCFLETLAFHCGIYMCSYAIIVAQDYFYSAFHAKPPVADSAIRQQLRVFHIPLTVLYSSLPKLFLLSLLTIWRPSSAQPAAPAYFTALVQPADVLHPLLPRLASEQRLKVSQFIVRAFDDDRLDREWIVRNLLGGMAAGFGLRVALDCHPLSAMFIILVGWATRTVAAVSLSKWVGRAGGSDSVNSERLSQAWLAYSIP